MFFDKERLETIIREGTKIVEKEPPLLRLDFQDTLVVGDTHGDYTSTKKAIEYSLENNLPIIFLGDYVDRGPQQIENITYLMEAKVERPNSVFLLRGNHESITMNLSYGFFDVVARQLGRGWYEKFAEFFKNLPYAVLLREKVLLLHGGIPEGVKSIREFEHIPKGEEDPSDAVAFQIVWNDPDEFGEGFSPSPRGGGARLYGYDVFNRFMQENNLCLLVRSHEPQPLGYRFIFNNKLLTVFSCRYYNLPPKAARISDCKAEIIDIE